MKTLFIVIMLFSIYAEAQVGLKLEQQDEDGIFMTIGGSVTDRMLFFRSSINTAGGAFGSDFPALEIQSNGINNVTIGNTDNNGQAGTDARLIIRAGSETVPDLQLEGDGIVSTQGDFIFELDDNKNSNEAEFIVTSKDGGFHYLVLSESFDHQIVGSLDIIAGSLDVSGSISKGSGTFKIDHPLDPKNKYLYHSFVESPDMMNVYNGNVTLNEIGKAVIIMPDYFDALNKEFRYQLTSIGAPGPNLYISKIMENNAFEIAGGNPSMQVSWQVTGIRNDPYARENRIQVEEEKEPENKGKYIHHKAWAKHLGLKDFENTNSLKK